MVASWLAVVLVLPIPVLLSGCGGFCVGGGDLQAGQGDCDTDRDCSCGLKCGSANCEKCNANIFGNCDDCCYCKGAPWPKGDKAPEGCYWDGTAPFCSGKCSAGTKTLFSGKGGYGAQCVSGEKVLCCFEDSPSLKAQITHGKTVLTEIENECQKYTTQLIQDYGCDRVENPLHAEACKAVVPMAYCAFMEVAQGRQLQCELTKYLPRGAEPSSVGSAECWKGALASLGVRENPCA